MPFPIIIDFSPYPPLKVGCSLGGDRVQITSRVWRIDGRPASNIARSVVVSVQRESADLTTEGTLVGPIGPGDVPTFSTSILKNLELKNPR